MLIIKVFFRREIHSYSPEVVSTVGNSVVNGAPLRTAAQAGYHASSSRRWMPYVGAEEFCHNNGYVFDAAGRDDCNVSGRCESRQLCHSAVDKLGMKFYFFFMTTDIVDGFLD